MRSLIKASLLLGLVFSLQACSLFSSKTEPAAATKPIDSLPPHWVIKGKIGWKSPDERGSASLYWQQQDAEFTLKLFGPLGQGGGTVSGNDQAITIQAKGEEPLYSKDPETLMNQVFGFYVPIDRLRYWMKGMSHPDSNIDFTLEPATESTNTSSHRDDSGWQIDYSRLRNVNDWQLPHKLVLTQPQSQVVVTLLINRWQLADQ